MKTTTTYHGNLPNHQQITGIVLCGGHSTRMGKDKGLLPFANLTWAELAAQKFASLPVPVVVSVNPGQHPLYTPFFSPEQLISDNVALAVKGPLLGLLTVHLRFPNAALFVLACDMKDVPANLLLALLQEFKNKSCEAVVYSTGEQLQPLCGIYSADGLRKLYKRLQSGELKRFSMMHALEVINTLPVPVKESDFPLFNNYNHPDDL